MFKSFNLGRSGLERVLGELESAVMEELWRMKAASVRQVHDAISDRGLAYTTVMTVMGRLVDKGLLARETAGNGHVYAPAITRTQLESSMVAQVAASLKDMALPALVHFADQLPSDPEVLERLERLVAERRAALGGELYD